MTTSDHQRAPLQRQQQQEQGHEDSQGSTGQEQQVPTAASKLMERRGKLRPRKSVSEMTTPCESRNELKTLEKTEVGVPVAQVTGSLMFTVGHYKVCHLIGSGGGGRVYAGLDQVTGKQVALKICSKQLTGRQLARLRTEYNVMSNLQHKNILKLHGVFENDSRLCLVMDYAEGGDLFEYIKSQKRLPRNEARRIFKQLVSALSYMHSQGYMHRDLKPENCLLDKDCNVLLADFGFSNFWSSYKLETEGVGSLNYASPEIITSAATYVGPEVDLWSLGAVLYTMVTGKLPFYASDPTSTHRKIRKGAWRVDGNIKSDPEVFDLLCRLLEPDPLRRATIWDVINHPYYKNGSKIISRSATTTTTTTSGSTTTAITTQTSPPTAKCDVSDRLSFLPDSSSSSSSGSSSSFSSFSFCTSSTCSCSVCSSSSSSPSSPSTCHSMTTPTTKHHFLEPIAE